MPGGCVRHTEPQATAGPVQQRLGETQPPVAERAQRARERASASPVLRVPERPPRVRAGRAAVPAPAPAIPGRGGVSTAAAAAPRRARATPSQAVRCRPPRRQSPSVPSSHTKRAKVSQPVVSAVHRGRAVRTRRSVLAVRRLDGCPRVAGARCRSSHIAHRGPHDLGAWTAPTRAAQAIVECPLADHRAALPAYPDPPAPERAPRRAHASASAADHRGGAPMAAAGGRCGAPSLPASVPAQD